MRDVTVYGVVDPPLRITHCGYADKECNLVYTMNASKVLPSNLDVSRIAEMSLALGVR
jgi:hypothetical protein